MIATVDKHMRSLKDGDIGLVVSGENRQLSNTSQVWAVLSGVFNKAECREILLKTDSFEFEYTMHSPYMYHYYVEALFKANLAVKRKRLFVAIGARWWSWKQIAFLRCLIPITKVKRRTVTLLLTVHAMLGAVQLPIG